MKSQGHGAWAGGHFAGKGEAGGGALFDLLLEVQVVGVAILLVAVDSVGGREPGPRASATGGEGRLAAPRAPGHVAFKALPLCVAY